MRFQSTLPARGATPQHTNSRRSYRISIHAPCTGSDSITADIDPDNNISIHAPCTGSDTRHKATADAGAISIHAPCTGSDDSVTRSQLIFANFNPRSLHGERHSRLRLIVS